MSRRTRSRRPQPTGPGFVRVSDIARHLAVDRDTARKLVAEARLRPVPGLQRYRWVDVWRLTGVAKPETVPTEDWEALKAPLLTTRDVADRLGLHEATVRRHASACTFPAIRVGAQWRFRTAALEALCAMDAPEADIVEASAETEVNR